MSKFDVSDLHTVDMAFGGLIVEAINAIDPEACPYNLQEYLKRDSQRQVIRGDFDSPREFIRAVRRHQKQQKPEDLNKFNQATLPIINYFRPLGFESAPTEFASMVEAQTGFSDDLLQRSKVAINFLTLTYKVVFMATDRASVERMALAWHMHIAKKRSGGHKFEATYNFCGHDYEFPLVIEDPQTLQANSLISGTDEGKLFALEVEHEVNAPVLYGEQVNITSPIKWKVGFKLVEG